LGDFASGVEGVGGFLIGVINEIVDTAKEGQNNYKALAQQNSWRKLRGV